MIWDQLIYFAGLSAACWIIAAVLAFTSKKTWPAISVSLLGSFIFLTFIAGMWIGLRRPPLQTMGETRLWYSFFLSVVGVAIYAKWRYKWILSYGSLMAIVFVCINILKPEIHQQGLPKALQSIWFVPHVTVYMFAYAMMGAVALLALYLWIRSGKQDPSDKEMKSCDQLVRIGWIFLSAGMLMGAIWAKQAWGAYWTWDPKENWALATWGGYLFYLIYRRWKPKDYSTAFAIALFSFLLLQMCWYGVNYLPSARAKSLHVYS